MINIGQNYKNYNKLLINTIFILEKLLLNLQNKAINNK
jgi:hypothetical protein